MKKSHYSAFLRDLIDQSNEFLRRCNLWRPPIKHLPVHKGPFSPRKIRECRESLVSSVNHPPTFRLSPSGSRLIQMTRTSSNEFSHIWRRYSRSANMVASIRFEFFGKFLNGELRKASWDLLHAPRQMGQGTSDQRDAVAAAAKHNHKRKQYQIATASILIESSNKWINRTNNRNKQTAARVRLTHMPRVRRRNRRSRHHRMGTC